MKKTLGGVIGITIVLFVSATLSMQYDTFVHRAGAGAHGPASHSDGYGAYAHAPAAGGARTSTDGTRSGSASRSRP
jgi:hypothetical protein